MPHELDWSRAEPVFRMLRRYTGVDYFTPDTHRRLRLIVAHRRELEHAAREAERATRQKRTP